MTCEYFPGSDGQWYVRLRYANNRKFTASEGYTREWSAKRAAKKVGKVFGVPVVKVAE